MLDGIKKTQPVFQLWMKGTFKIFRGFTQPLGAQPSWEEEPNTKQKSKLHLWGQIPPSCGSQPYLEEVQERWREKVVPILLE